MCRPATTTKKVCAAEKSVIVDREVRAAGETGSDKPTEKPRPRRQRRASIRPPRWRLRKSSPGPKRTILPPRRPAARSLMKRLRPCHRRSLRRRSMRSKCRRIGARPRSVAVLLLRGQRPATRRWRWLLLRQRPNRRARAVAAGGSARARASSGNRSSEAHACVSDASSGRSQKTGSRPRPGGQTAKLASGVRATCRRVGSCEPVTKALNLRGSSRCTALPTILRPPPRAGAPASPAPSESPSGSTAPGRRAKPVRLGALPTRPAR